MKKYFETNQVPDSTHIKVELFYSKGGYNYFTGKEEKRGMYISFTPVSREERDGYSMESFVAFSGVKFLVKEMKRKSQKAIDEIENKLAEVVDVLAMHFECNHQYQLVQGVKSFTASL